MNYFKAINNLNIKINVLTTNHENTVRTSILKEERLESTLIVSGEMSATDKRVNIAGINLLFDDLEFSPNARILTRDQTMSANVKLFDLKHTPFALESEVYCVFELAADEYFLAGMSSWNTFTGKFKFKDQQLSVTLPGDGKIIEKGETLALEKIALIKGKSSQEVLEKYADIIAEEFNIQCKDVTWRGWGSWDYYAEQFGEKEILENFNFLKEQKINCNLIQIDDGYCMWGDWLAVNKDTFPDGIKGVSEKIQADNYTPGIWMAPFLGDKNSALFAKHPEWFLYDGSGNPLTDMVNDKVNYVLDYSIDEVCDWLYNVLHTMKGSWGIKYFKLDFLERGVWPCKSAVEGVTPLERFHRCFKSVKTALGDDVYILGCSATLGPSIGYIDGMRTGPDVSPNFDEIRKTANCSARNWFLDKKLFNCDADYLVLRSEEDEENDHCGKANKVGKLSLSEAQAWNHFISIYGNAGIISDKLPCLRSERFELFKHLCNQIPTEKCIPIDLWNGGGDYVPRCYLCVNSSGITLNLFNWDNDIANIAVRGIDKEDCFIDVDDNRKLDNTDDIICTTITAHGSKQLKYQGERSFAELKSSLYVKCERLDLLAQQITGLDYSYEGEIREINLGDNAKTPLCFNRLTGQGMLNGRCSDLIAENNLLGIPFKFRPDHQIIEISTSDNPCNTRIMINDNFKTLYILHACEYPVKGYLNNYNVKYSDHTEEIKINLEDHVGNSSAEYSLPWNGENARIAWHSPQNDACLYLMKWDNPYPEKMINEIEITWPQQRANLFIVAMAGVVNDKNQ